MENWWEKKGTDNLRFALNFITMSKYAPKLTLTGFYFLLAVVGATGKTLEIFKLRKNNALRRENAAWEALKTLTPNAPISPKLRINRIRNPKTKPCEKRFVVLQGWPPLLQYDQLMGQIRVSLKHDWPG
ncbi:hypothetical protein Nepgr_012701 [Nepenthes gracilis]|uniref:Uncharacterized protein n=1 Tax=Nepenthes gracilis TaxID=150966 RepID=A0AAD3XNL2_NEPGR|nr:hypothetical protein Nepgr_012701 [Nepenthes gracilis]